jgi:hypothetical protein
MIEQTAIDTIEVMLDKAFDLGEGTTYKFEGYMPCYAIQALNFYFNTRLISHSQGERTIKYGDWYVTLAFEKSKLTAIFDSTNGWRVRRELETLGFMPNEAFALYEEFAEKGREVFDAFCEMVSEGQISPDNYSF